MPRGSVSVIGRATLGVNSSETTNLYFTFLYAHRLIASFLTPSVNTSSPATFCFEDSFGTSNYFSTC